MIFLAKHNKAIRAAQRKAKADYSTPLESHDDRSMLQAVVEGNLSGDFNDGQTAVRAAKYMMLREIQNLAGHAIIRRTHASVGPTGPLILFPPKRKIEYYITLPPREQQNLMTIATTAVAANRRSENARVIKHGGVETAVSFQVSGGPHYLYIAALIIGS